MNIFVLDINPDTCAQHHCDKHLVKMILETAQILCTSLYLKSGGKITPKYRPTHKNHPCVKWTISSDINYSWLCELGIALAREYTHRYGRTHKSLEVIIECIDLYEAMFDPDYRVNELEEHYDQINFIFCGPEECIKSSVVGSYRTSYNEYKSINMQMKWTNRAKPEWFNPSRGGDNYE